MTEHNNRRSFLKKLTGGLAAGTVVLLGKATRSFGSNHIQPLSSGTPAGTLVAEKGYTTCKKVTGPCEWGKGLVCKEFTGPCGKEVACRDHKPSDCNAGWYKPPTCKPAKDYSGQCPQFQNTQGGGDTT